jgi:hypothetical protein
MFIILSISIENNLNIIYKVSKKKISLCWKYKKILVFLLEKIYKYLHFYTFFYIKNFNT